MKGGSLFLVKPVTHVGLLLLMIVCHLVIDDTSAQEHQCGVCKKEVSNESKTLECNKCKRVFHYECAAYDIESLQELLEKMGWICKDCLAQEIKEYAMDFGKKAAVSGGIAAAVIAGIPLAVGALGFGAAGVTAGSAAAAFQSAYLGGNIAAGSTFALLQSIGAAGLATTTQVAIGAVTSVLPFLSNLKTNNDTRT